MKHVKRTEFSFFVVALLVLCQPIAVNASVLQKFRRVVNVFVGPAANVVRDVKVAKKQIEEIRYWFTASTSKTMHETSLHEAGHAFVAHKLGFDVEYVQIQRRQILLRSKKDDEQYIYEGLTKIKDIDVEKLNTEDLENIVCFLRGGGLATQLDFQNSYGDSSDKKQIAVVTEEIIKKNSSKIARVFYVTKKVAGLSFMVKMISSPAYIAGRDFDFKAKKIQDACEVATRSLLIKHKKELYVLVKALEEVEEDEGGVKVLSAERFTKIMAESSKV